MSSGETLLKVAHKKETSFSDWYTEIVTKAELISYSDISGCYVLRPNSFSVWEAIQEHFNRVLRARGVKNCYFPMFVSKSKLDREKEHLEGFSPEVAWVTKYGEQDFDCPIAVRPTSETIIYPHFSDWIRSHRDLPCSINQWCNVVRWEFSHPTPFIRSREFLWQEGHSVFLTSDAADREVREILEEYRRLYEELLAVAVTPGRKSEREKFAGSSYTLTVEAFIASTGKSVQGATAHALGRSFSKMFDIAVEDPERRTRANLWQTSWGISTRSIGVMIMTHSDDQGVVFPPRVAPVQVILVPCGIKAGSSQEERQLLTDRLRTLREQLTSQGVRAEIDVSDRTPGWKFNYWELRGVPLRLELGPKDLARSEVTLCYRHTGLRRSLSLSDGLGSRLVDELDEIQADLLARSRASLADSTGRETSWSGFVEQLDRRRQVLVPWCEGIECEGRIREQSQKDSQQSSLMGAKSLCQPFHQDSVEGLSCVGWQCPNSAKSWFLFGRSY
jgi:prolyl-tRNA synthetase